MSKLLDQMRALAGLAERPMWETKITLPGKEYKSGSGNKSGTPRSGGTGSGDNYEEPETDDEFETDDDSDKKSVEKAKKKYKADKEKEDAEAEAEIAAMSEPEEAPEDEEEPSEEEPEEGDEEEKEDDEEDEEKDDEEEEDEEEDEDEDEKPKKKKKEEALIDEALLLILEATMSVADATKMLELPTGWSTSDLKAAYKRAAHKHHPDKGGDNQKMMMVIAAYKILQKVTPSDVKQDSKARVARELEKTKEMVTSTINNLFDPAKYASYFHKMTGKVYTFKVEDKVAHARVYKDVVWTSADNETVFALSMSTSLYDVKRVKSLGGSGGEPALAFSLLVMPTVLHDNRKSKMRKKNWDFSSKQSTLVDPTKVFPKSSIKKMMSGKDKKRKFSRRDMVTAIQQRLKGSTDTSGGALWARIPVGEYELRLYRTTMFRQAVWDAHSVRAKVNGKWKTFKTSKRGAFVSEAEGLIELLKQVQKHRWNNPQALIDTVATQMKAMWDAQVAADKSKKESMLGGGIPGSEPHNVTHLPKCCDSCFKGKECEKKDKKKMSVKAKMESLLERQREEPALGHGEKPTRKGSFKVSTKELKFWADEIDKAGQEAGPQALLFKKVRNAIHAIPRNDLPQIWGKDNMADAQDVVMGKPRRAFQMWLRNVKKVSPKMHGYLQRVPSNVSLVYFGFMTRVVGMMSAKQIFKRYFETESDHVGGLKGKAGQDAYSKKTHKKMVKDAMAKHLASKDK